MPQGVEHILNRGQKTHQTFPGTVVKAVDDHDSDEDLTVEIQVPSGSDQQHVSDELIQIALAVEDKYRVTIVTHTIMAKPAEA